MVNESAARGVIEAVEPDDFYRDRHRAILRAIATLREQETPVDPITVADELSRRDELEAAGGAEAISALASTCPAPGNAEHYAAIVRDRAVERERHKIGRGLLDGLPPADALERLRQLDLRGASGLATRVADFDRIRPVRWLWERRLPLGYLALLLGAEGMGKGTLAAWIIARTTRGELPGDLYGEPARALVIGDEDSFDSVIAPRLYAAGADFDFVVALEESDGELLDLRQHATRLRALVHDGDYRLVYVDALLDTLGVDVDDWRSKAVRDALRPLRRTARDLDVCALGALHPNKGARSSFRELVSGSHAFNASSRSSLLLTRHPEDEDRRVLVRGKGNFSAAPRSFEFAIEGRDLEINDHRFSLPVVADEREGELGIDDVVRPERSAPVRQTLADEIDALGAGGIQTRAELARALGRESDDRSVGRALDQLERERRWEKVSRGKWRRLGIGASSEAPMSNQDDEGSE